MICPRCNNKLSLTSTQGVEIDLCSNCRGVWLDRGELEKIIERSNSYENLNSSEHHDKYSNHHQSASGSHIPRRNKGFLSELFDF